MTESLDSDCAHQSRDVNKDQKSIEHFSAIRYGRNKTSTIGRLPDKKRPVIAFFGRMKLASNITSYT